MKVEISSTETMHGNLLLPSNNSKPIFDDTDETVRFVREQPPAHCLMKIDCFSVLQNAFSRPSENHFDSTEFKAGGYTWVLSVYPNGNEEEDGEDYLSLYVKMVDKLSPGKSVYVALRFFIYDQIRDNYLTVLVIRDKRFQALKTTWGVSKILPVESFKDAANGFVRNDCCVLGAEVFVGDDDQIKISTLSIQESKSERSYSWSIQNLSDLNNDKIFSPVFSFGVWSWKLFLYPRGCGRSKGKDLSLFLELNNPGNLSHGSKLFTKYRFCIKNQNKGADHKKKGNISS
ncbi:hypothetical protein BVRB_9g223550 [Beta vulgaris subsp. vulgaris]|nr:hypothetical protein BVRB_9g223550 [Beta vulgaris subsp. vulgaris]